MQLEGGRLAAGILFQEFVLARRRTGSRAEPPVSAGAAGGVAVSLVAEAAVSRVAALGEDAVVDLRPGSIEGRARLLATGAGVTPALWERIPVVVSVVADSRRQLCRPQRFRGAAAVVIAMVHRLAARQHSRNTPPARDWRRPRAGPLEYFQLCAMCRSNFPVRIRDSLVAIPSNAWSTFTRGILCDTCHPILPGTRCSRLPLPFARNRPIRACFRCSGSTARPSSEPVLRAGQMAGRRQLLHHAGGGRRTAGRTWCATTPSAARGRCWWSPGSSFPRGQRSASGGGVRLVSRQQHAADLHQHPAGLAAEHPGRLLGARSRDRPAHTSWAEAMPSPPR